jgi:hypothetical protein
MAISTEFNDRPAPTIESPSIEITPEATGPKLTRAQASRKNGRMSCGPRTEAGKCRSRYNAIKHGMTADSTLLPGEAGADLEARRRRLYGQFPPRNDLEEIMIDRVARDEWMSLRTERAAIARQEYRRRHEAHDRARAQRQQVIECSQLLLTALSSSEPWTVEADPGGPHHPARLLDTLEFTVQGCDWLLARLDQLDSSVQAPARWVHIHGFELVRLMGHFPIDFAADSHVAAVLLASELVARQTQCVRLERSGVAAQNRATLEADAAKQAKAKTRPGDKKSTNEQSATNCGDRQRDTSRQRPKTQVVQWLVDRCRSAEDIFYMPIDHLVPDNAEEARDRLAQVIGNMITRLEAIRAECAALDEADDADLADRHAALEGHEANLQRRYILARDRLLNRTIDEFIKIRKAVDDGTLAASDIDPDEPVDPTAADPRTPSGRPAEIDATVQPSATRTALDTSPTRQHGSSSDTNPIGSAEGGPRCPGVSPSNCHQAPADIPAVFNQPADQIVCADGDRDCGQPVDEKFHADDDSKSAQGIRNEPEADHQADHAGGAHDLRNEPETDRRSMRADGADELIRRETKANRQAVQLDGAYVFLPSERKTVCKLNPVFCQTNPNPRCLPKRTHGPPPAACRARRRRFCR